AQWLARWAPGWCPETLAILAVSRDWCMKIGPLELTAVYSSLISSGCSGTSVKTRPDVSTSLYLVGIELDGAAADFPAVDVFGASACLHALLLDLLSMVTLASPGKTSVASKEPSGWIIAIAMRSSAMCSRTMPEVSALP